MSRPSTLSEQEVKMRPQLVTDSAAPQQLSQDDNLTIVSIENIINITCDELQMTKMAKCDKTDAPASPNPSMRSTTISIASIESDAASSVIESDIDEFEDTATGCMVKKLGQQTASTVANSQIPNLSPEIAVLLGQQIERDVASPNVPQIASLSLTNSTDVTFGHKKYHRGPVTIQQILIEKPTYQQGNINPAFEGSNSCSSGSSATRTKQPECGDGNNRDHPTAAQKYTNILNHKAAIITAGIAILTLLVGIIVFTSTYILKDDVNGGPIPRLVSRDEWVAQPPNVPLDSLETPTPNVIITHTTTQNCSSLAMCIFRTRFIQTFDMESRSFDDIQYNFLVGGDGNVYVARGWDKSGAHTKGYNDDSVGIAFIGTFNKWAPPENQLNATKWLLDEGVRLKKLDPDFKLFGSRQLDPSSDGPGDALFNIINKWPNWSSWSNDF